MFFIGLGNRGEEYNNTRHNIGSMLIDDAVSYLCTQSGRHLEWVFQKKLSAFVAHNSSVNPTLYFAKPYTYMNTSGNVVSKLVNYYKVSPEKIVVIHDDADLNVGIIKVSFGKSSAGHKGVQSIIDELGTKDFWRIRVGIGRPQHAQYNLNDWVLSKFSTDELQNIKSSFNHVLPDILNTAYFASQKH